MTNSPTCRGCYLATLANDERARAAAEPVTMPMHLCRDHRIAMDELMDRIVSTPFEKLAFGHSAPRPFQLIQGAVA